MGFLKNFLGNRLSKPLDFGQLICDFHSHLIPGIDDGAKDLEDSIQLIKQFKELGFRKIITTPHIQDEFYKNTPEIISSGLEKVKAAIAEANIDIELVAAAEYLIDDGFEKKMKNNELLTFGPKYILIEFSYFSPHPNLKTFIFDLQIEGYNVILAHPERYSYWFGDFKKFDELKDRGILFQLNTVSLGGHYGNDIKKIAKKMIDLEMIDLLGSDMHNQHCMNSFIAASHEKYLHKLVESGKLMNHLL